MSDKPRLMDQVRSAIRSRHYSYRTEQAYTDWIIQFIKHHELKHPLDMGDREVTDFLTYLAVERNVAPSTQNQALSSLQFLYKHALRKPLGDSIQMVRAKQNKRLPTVLTRNEVREIHHRRYFKIESSRKHFRRILLFAMTAARPLY